ncbi:MAG TPA: hypothetical protein H9880_11745 [Candidatus Anaerobutyricum avicola]|nr:hypothetical protein [Candidatus Anaerobutyricum avicola]
MKRKIIQKITSDKKSLTSPENAPIIQIVITTPQGGVDGDKEISPGRRESFAGR